MERAWFKRNQFRILARMEDLNPEKAQHILIDKKIIEKEISEAKLDKKDRVIEIGAGTGVLTKKLIKAEKVLAFEKDEKFREELEKLKTDNPNLEVIYDDALRYNWQGYNKIVSNIPYFLAGDVILKAINYEIETLVLITGEIFKTKLETENGKIGVIANLFYDIKPIMKVSPYSFEPQPKTDSWLLKLTKKKKGTKTENLLKRILVRENKIKNAIMYALVDEGKTKNQAREIIRKMNFSKDVLNKSIRMATDKFILRLKEELDKLEQ